jgi:hypothetical protein
MHSQDAAWFYDRFAAVEQQLCVPLRGYRARFPTVDRLLSRAERLRGHHRELSPQLVDEFREVQNELTVARHILATDAYPTCELLEYEPDLPLGSRKIDFRVHLSDGSCLYVEVKTIHPQMLNRWDAYVATVSRDLLPDNVNAHFEEEWLGGELWHLTTAARSKMLDYTLDFEGKLASCSPDEESISVLVFCGDGFRWHRDELEDFVQFYRSGYHRQDDPFSKMELHAIELKGITLQRTVDHFGFVARRDEAALPHRFLWSVQSPPEPWLVDP